MLYPSKSKSASVLLILYFILTPISIYYNLEVQLVIFFLLVGSLIGIKNFSSLRNIQNNLNKKRIFFWGGYVVISILSTIFFQHSNFENFRGIFYEVMLLAGIYPLSLEADTKYFFIVFRNIIVILALISLISQAIHFDPFYSMRSQALLTGIDTTSGGGIASLFEYRHYYATFLVFSIIITWLFPIKNVVVNVIVNTILVINLLLTYTRSAWIAFLILLFIFVAQQHPKIGIKSEIKIRTIYSIIVLVILMIIIGSIFFGNIGLMLANIENRFNQVLIDSTQYGGASGVRGYVINEGINYFFKNWKKYILIGGGNGFALQWLKANPYGLTIHWTAAIDVQYVTTLMNSGICGLYCLLSFLYLNIKGIFKHDLQKNPLSFIFLTFLVIFWFFDVIPFMSSIFMFWNICVCLSFKNEAL